MGKVSYLPLWHLLIEKGMTRSQMRIEAGLATNVLADSEKLLTAWEDTLENETADKEYILAGSDSRYILKSELQEFTAEQCRLARNEIYARHGRKFDDEYIQDYFNSKDWHMPTIAPDEFEESLLNSYELVNRDLIVEYEEECGYR